MKLAYVVTIGWRNQFMFDDMSDAGFFAIQAKTHRTENSEDNQITIKIIDIDAAEEVEDD